MSYVTSYFHIVFTTRNREAVITHPRREDLYRVMASIINDCKCKAELINGVENHIHILLNLNPTVALSDLMRNLKSKSSLWAKKCGYYPMFRGWASEYGAFSLSASHREAVYSYISNQQEHHQNKNLDEEFRRLVMKNGLTFYDWTTPNDADTTEAP